MMLYGYYLVPPRILNNDAIALTRNPTGGK